MWTIIFAAGMLINAPSEAKIKTIYNSLDPRSISQHLAFYELYPNTQMGRQALNDAWNLLSAGAYRQGSPPPPLPRTINALLHLVNKMPDEQGISFPASDLAQIERIGSFLGNRRLKGFGATTEEEVLALPTEEIDLARGLLLSQLEPSENRLDIIRSYEAVIDLMALQILAKLPPESTPEQQIRSINNYIFEEMGFRFPPHSLYAKDVDLYTFLPSVLDSRRGVCLGVSILYLCLSQRLGLPLEIITPPGHIYVRYSADGKEINIETTARGIHVESEEYLGVDTRSLQKRNTKEVIGMAHVNHASVYWQQKNYEKALNSYRKGFPYMPEDGVIKELMGYNCLFNGLTEEGTAILVSVKDYCPEYAVSKQNIAEDFLNDAVDVDGIKSIFTRVDETRESVLKKREALEAVVEKFPNFRAGIFNLAVTWLQLHRMTEALHYLERYHALDATDPSVEYYLSAIYAERLDYNKSWEHLKNAEKIVAQRNHNPKALKELRKELSRRCPE